MQRNRPPSAQAINVLRALAADPSRWRYGYDLGTQVRLKSGSLYPILVRLADRGLLEATWEPGPEGRPPRHLYRLSAAGREYVAALPAAQADRVAQQSHLRWNEASGWTRGAPG
jgi:PadR family transcriptional regulator PadR